MTLQGALDGAKRRQLNCGEDETSAKRPKPDAAVKLVGSHHKQGKNNKQAAFNISDADEQQKLQLLDALAQFERQMPSRQLFLEVDAVRDVDADALVGRQVRVLWPEDEAWYLGIIASFDDRTGKHHVDYADGDQGEELLALERVRLLVHAGEQLPAPPLEQLSHQAQLLLSKARGRDKAVALARSKQLLAAAERRAAAHQAPPATRPERAMQRPAAAGGGAGGGDAGLQGALVRPGGGGVAAEEQAEQTSLGMATGERGMVESGAEGWELGSPSGVQHREGSHPQEQRGGDAQQEGQLGQSSEPGCQEGAAGAQAMAVAMEEAEEKEKEGVGSQGGACPGGGGTEAWGTDSVLSVLPGEVVWGRVPGYRDWPALVITREEAADRGAPSAQTKSPNALPILYFGTAEVSCLRSTVLTRFREGVWRYFHCSKPGRREQAFRRAIGEVETYLRTGELPPSMLPDHNDGVGGEEEEEAAAGVGGPGRRGKGRAGGGKRRAGGQEGGVGPGGVQLPFQANKSVRVMCLGRVEWLHPGFHDASHIWPVGYVAERAAATPASRGQLVPHRCEVVWGAEACGPLFRVTPKGGQPVEGPTATAAWQALYAADWHGSVRSMGISGPAMFGLTIPRVAALIQQLPDAARCDKYCGWAEGEQPEVPPLTSAEQHARLRCLALSQRLPPGVVPVPLHGLPPGGGGQHAQRGGGSFSRGATCEVCMNGEEEGDDAIIQCDACLAFVHMSCYGMEDHPQGDLWLCDTCSLGLPRPPACVLCPVEGGVMKPTACGRWCHAACSLWTEETRLDPEKGIIQGIQQVKAARLRLSCKVCRQQYGSCVQCAGSAKCYDAFHPLCAWGAGLHMELVEDYYSSSESEDDSGDENDAAAPNLLPPRARAKRRRGRAKDGTGLGNGMRLQAYCQRHGPPRHGPWGQQPGAGGGVEGCAAAASCLSLREGRDGGEEELAGCSSSTGGGGSEGGLWGVGQGRVPAGGNSLDWWRKVARRAALGGEDLAGEGDGKAPFSAAGRRESPFFNPHGCARAAPFNYAARRGQRAPEALAAADAKRLFVRSVPYLVGGPMHCRAEQLPPSRCLPPAPADHRTPPAEEGQLAKSAPPRTAAQPGMASASAEGAGAAEAGGEQECVAEGGGGAPNLAPPQQPTARQSAPAAAVPCPGQRGVGSQQEAALPIDAGLGGMERGSLLGRSQPSSSSSPGVTLGTFQAALEGGGLCRDRVILSQSQRFAAMQQSLGQRVTIGKSGIHGWGAFAKQPLPAGSMVIEYAGEVVRHSVSDVRERRMYNSMVGAGTYVFSLHDHLNVDATRAGNMAHILNHCCQPNCFSRVVRVRGGSGKVEDRVVIYAQRDIQIGEELTYDYNFSGREQLPCNCRAPNCRGLVNKAPKREGLWVMRSKLKPHFPPAAPPAC